MVKQYTLKDYQKRLDDEGTFFALIDLRSPADFKKSHLPNALNAVDENSLLSTVESVTKGDHEKSVILFKNFQSVADAGSITRTIEEAGYHDVYVLVGDISAWKSRDLPTDPPKIDPATVA